MELIFPAFECHLFRKIDLYTALRRQKDAYFQEEVSHGAEGMTRVVNEELDIFDQILHLEMRKFIELQELMHTFWFEKSFANLWTLNVLLLYDMRLRKAGSGRVL